MKERSNHNFKDPLQAENISPRALAYKRLLDTATWGTMQLEGCRGNQLLPQYRYAKETLATVRDEVKRFGFNEEGFDLAVKLQIERIKEEEAKDYDAETAIDKGEGTIIYQQDAGFPSPERKYKGW